MRSTQDWATTVLEVRGVLRGCEEMAGYKLYYEYQERIKVKKNLVVAHRLGGRVAMGGAGEGGREGGVGRREIMCGCGLRELEGRA